MKSLKIKILSPLLVAVFAFSGLALAPVAYGADEIGPNVCGGTGLELGSGDCEGAEQRRHLENTVSRIVNLLSVIVGIVAVVMIIIGGFKYITSGGDSGSITSAKHTIIYAIVGLIIVALAQVIVRFVLSKT